MPTSTYAEISVGVGDGGKDGVLVYKDFFDFSKVYFETIFSLSHTF